MSKQLESHDGSCPNCGCVEVEFTATINSMQAGYNARCVRCDIPFLLYPRREEFKKVPVWHEGMKTRVDDNMP